MGKRIQAIYDQIFLLPPTLEELVPANHQARFVRDFVDMLSLEELGFRIPEAIEGRPPYAPDLLLKVWVYGYLKKIRTTRALEEACHEQFAFAWLTGMNYPDHNTLWRFMSINELAFKGVFRQVLFVAMKAGLVGMVLHALDGTKIAADVSSEGLWRRKDLSRQLKELDTAIDEIMEKARLSEKAESDCLLPEELGDLVDRKDKIKAALSELGMANRDYLHPVDRDARMMHSLDGLGMAYNAQAVVDQASGLIVAEEVVNEETDHARLVSMVNGVRDNLGEVASETVADAGYYAPGELAKAEEAGINVVVNLPQSEDKRWNKGELKKSDFNYVVKDDKYICPLGQELRYEQTRRRSGGKYLVRIYRCHHGKDCPRAGDCSRDKRGRYIERGEHEGAVERQREKQNDCSKKALLKKRKGIIEPVFAHIKERHGLRRFSVRGLEKVRAQWSLVCTAINLGKLYRSWVAGRVIME